MSSRSPFSAPEFAARPIAADIERLLDACPAPAAFFEVSPAVANAISCAAANSAALALLRIDLGELAAAERGPALLACLHDEREPAFHERVRACAAGGEAPPLKLLARRHGSAAPFARARPRPEGGALAPFDGLRIGEVLLEARFAPMSGGVAVFFEEARARGAELPEGFDPMATQRALFQISHATHEAPTLDALFGRIDGIVERLIGARNLFIALVDEAEQMIRFVYARDEFSPPRDRRIGCGVTELVYFSGQPLLLDRAKADQLLEAGTIVNHGVPAQVWLGVPLVVAGRAVGVIAVQDYHNPHLLGENERQLLSYISDQIANAIAVKRAGDVAAAARAEVERAGRVKADFIGVMSHELRTPLTAVIGFSDLLKERLAGTNEGKQAASIEQAGLRLLEAINHMLDFSRLDAFAEPVHEETVNLEELLVVIHGAFSVKLREKNLTYSLRREGFVPECVRTDTQILKQILLHLLGNAVKFTPIGGRVRVFLRADQAVPFQANRHRLVLTVEDTGSGITPELMPRLFEPFERAHTPGSMQGVGLGLAISQRLAALLGGKITVRSSPLEGSAFTLSFNATAATRTGQPPEQPDATAQREWLLRSRIAGANWQVLVVDANADNRAIVAGLVESVSGCTTLVAASDAEALALAAKTRPLIVLVDVAGADSAGIALCRALREQKNPDGPESVVALSVDHSPELVQRCLTSGADNYLPKPLSRRGLIEALLSGVEKARR